MRFAGIRTTSGRMIAIVGVAGVALAMLVSPASAKSSKKADLTISKSAVKITSGVLTGSFTARNAGKKRAKASRAGLYLQTSQGSLALASYGVGSLKKKKSRTVGMAVTMPTGLTPATRQVRLCLDVNHRVKEKSEANNCRTIGTHTSPALPPPPGDGIPHPAAGSNLVTNVVKNNVVGFTEPYGKYWAYVPTSYDDTHLTPTALLVWMHGCGGDGQGDTWGVRPDFTQAGAGLDQHFSYIVISIGGADGDCWNMNTGPSLVKAAVYDAQSRFNIDPHRIILGGYSSGGDLAYRTAFYNAGLFAGVLAINTAPFRDTGSSQAASLAAASWKFNAFHILHDRDTTYLPSAIVPELEVMKTAGFPVGFVI